MYLVFVFALTYASVAAVPNTPSTECNTINNNYYGTEWEKKGSPISLQGLPGKRGATGSKGSIGVRGHKGEKGIRGPPGHRGSTGIKGATGAGQKGEKGEVPSNIAQEIADLKKKYEEVEALCQHVQHPRTCDDIQDVAMESGYYLISPNPFVLKPFYVYCNFTPAAAYTTFGHDNEAEKSVPDCEPPKCYSQNITYHNNMEQIRQVVQQSQSCRQFLKYRCQGSVMNWPGSGARASWSSYNGEERHNWGGSAQTHSCACGDTGTCVEPTKKCNCDNNRDDVNTSDEGYLNDKNYLPVTNLKFGDLGGANEHGWHTLGKLECFGSVN